MLKLRKFGRTILGSSLMLLATPAFSQSSLDSVEVVPLSEDQVAVELRMSGDIPEPRSFALESPPRISIDLPGATVALPNRRVPINQGVVDSLVAVEASGRSRVVLTLQELTTYVVDRVDGKIRILVSGAAGGRAPAATAASDEGIWIKNVDFRRTETGAGRVDIRLEPATASVDVRNEGGKIVATFKNTNIPDQLVRRLEVLDFATPVKFVDALRDGINTKIRLTPTATADFEQVAYQLADRFTIELQPLSQREQEERERRQPQFVGERINLNFQNIETRALLQILADVAGKNLVISDSVGGEVSLRLENVPWDQAMDIVMRTKGLSKSEEGNVIWIAPTSEVAAQQAKEIEALEQAEQLAPLSSEIIQVNYAKAADLAALISSDGTELLSDRGSVTTDERTNVLILRETRDKLEEIRRLIRDLDIPVKQVLIESRIVVASDDFSRQLGVRTGLTSTSDPSEAPFITTTGSAIGNDQIIFGGGAEDEGVINNGRVTELPGLDNRFNVNLPIAGNAGQIALAVLEEDFLVDLELSALQAEGRGELISSPRVITSNGKEAFIEQGEEIPFTAAGGGNAIATTQFKKAVLALRVTPQITPDNRISMQLEVSRDSRGAAVAQAGGGQAVGIDTRKVNTEVLVNNGETVVLGGIYEETILDNVTKVPLLGDLPIIGYLFRTTSKLREKGELLIFVTPKILSDGVKVN